MPKEQDQLREMGYIKYPDTKRVGRDNVIPKPNSRQSFWQEKVLNRLPPSFQDRFRSSEQAQNHRDKKTLSREKFVKGAVVVGLAGFFGGGGYLLRAFTEPSPPPKRINVLSSPTATPTDIPLPPGTISYKDAVKGYGTELLTGSRQIVGQPTLLALENEKTLLQHPVGVTYKIYRHSASDKSITLPDVRLAGEWRSLDPKDTTIVRGIIDPRSQQNKQILEEEKNHPTGQVIMSTVPMEFVRVESITDPNGQVKTYSPDNPQLLAVLFPQDQ